MTTQQTQIVALKSYLKTRMEEWERATKGPWLYQSDHQFVFVKVDHPVETHSIVSTRTSGFTSIEQGLCDRDAIAHARTDSPICLANTLREIEYLEEKLQLRPANFPNDGWNEGYNAFLEAMKQSLEIRLNEILDAFKEVLG